MTDAFGKVVDKMPLSVLSVLALTTPILLGVGFGRTPTQERKADRDQILRMLARHRRKKHTLKGHYVARLRSELHVLTLEDKLYRATRPNKLDVRFVAAANRCAKGSYGTFRIANKLMNKRLHEHVVFDRFALERLDHACPSLKSEPSTKAKRKSTPSTSQTRKRKSNTP